MQSGWDIPSLATLPAAVSVGAAGARDEVLGFRYQLPLGGALRRWRGELRAGPGGELPRPGDGLWLLGLLQLWLREGAGSEVVRFERRELFGLSGAEPGGPNYERLSAALRRLAAARWNLESVLTARGGAVYDRLPAEFGVIDRVDLSTGRPARCEVIWGPLVCEAQRLGDLKPLDWTQVVDLHNGVSAHLLRLCDTLALSGQDMWTVSWRALATLVGVRAEAYRRPARFRERLRAQLDDLTSRGALAGWAYERGGRFHLHLGQPLRQRLRRLLVEFGLTDAEAGRLVYAHDEARLMVHCDCLTHGCPPLRGTHPTRYLAAAIDQDYPLFYSADSVAALRRRWAAEPLERRRALARAADRLSPPSPEASPLEATGDPGAWTVRQRAVVRHLMDHGLASENSPARGPEALAVAGGGQVTGGRATREPFAKEQPHARN